jgi:hypothetical protein
LPQKKRGPEAVLTIFQTVSEGEFSEVRMQDAAYELR